MPVGLGREPVLKEPREILGANSDSIVADGNDELLD
jgi:hypothetical protein